jgi:phosphatidylglycerol:prolipoprotein diacylglycerol transferase
VSGVLAFAALAYPDIDPVAIQIGPVAIRWYALAYVAGLALGWIYLRRLAQTGLAALTRAEVDDLLFWVALGVILGGRLGYALFYRPDHYLAHPQELVMLWRGGMSFHGGLLGVVAALFWFAHLRRRPVLSVSDAVAPAIPIGLFFGRIANFINGELYGRIADADLPWAMAFPGGGPFLRHPSQLYEAGLEGLVLFCVLAWLIYRRGGLARRGLVTGAFLAGYALARATGELFREPDAHIGFLAGTFTMGQLLSLPMLLIGVWLIVRAQPWARRPG